MGLQFHETVRGKIFFEHQLPSLIKALNRFVDVFEMKEHHGIEEEPEEKRMIVLYGKMQKVEGFKTCLAHVAEKRCDRSLLIILTADMSRCISAATVERMKPLWTPREM